MKGKKNNKITLDNPYALNLFFTGKCNLNCRYCFVDKTGQENVTLNEKSLKKSVDLLFSYPGKKKTLSFNGGEPTLEFPLVKKIYNYARKKAKAKGISLDVAVMTNGTLLNQKMMDYFIRNNTILKISIDGNKLTHDRNRPFKKKNQSSSFDRIMENMSKINSEKLRVAASMVFTPKDLDYFLENIKFLNDKNFYYIEFYPDMYADWKARDLEKLKKIFKQFETYYTRLFLLKKKAFKNSLLDTMVNEVEIEKMDRCGKIHVNAAGDFYVCDKVFSLKARERKKYVVGNVKEGIDDKTREKILKGIRKDFFQKIGLACRKCQNYRYCFCPIGHYIYFLNKEKQRPYFWKSFCSIARIYSKIFLKIKSSLEYNDDFARLYRY